MPIMDGLTMLKELKQDPDYMRKVPVLVITTEASRELKQKGKSVGVNKWLLKPISNQVLYKVLDSMEVKI